MDPATGAVVPPNLVPGRFVHFTCDNIDINDFHLDGKNSFHATQVAAWQRGPEGDMGLRTLQPSNKDSTLKVPDDMDELLPAQIIIGRSEPTNTSDIKHEWFTATSENESAVQAVAKHMTFILKRSKEKDSETGWTQFNQTISTTDPAVTSVGYIMPIIQAPAHELDTLNTVIQRCKHVANKLGQHYVVLTADEALFCKVMELKWEKEEYQNILVVRLGGLHISLNFMKVIGKHMDCSGLVEAWVESNLLGPKTAEQVMAGKSYIRGMRSHKLTLQAMWRILLPQLLQYINEEKRELRQEIEDNVQKEDTDALLSLLASKQFRDLVDGFVASSDGSNFQFWWTYMKMVEILLMFTRASRDGDWKLHLHAFTSCFHT
jgi:hypothetical protein